MKMNENDNFTPFRSGARSSFTNNLSSRPMSGAQISLSSPSIGPSQRLGQRRVTKLPPVIVRGRAALSKDTSMNDTVSTSTSVHPLIARQRASTPTVATAATPVSTAKPAVPSVAAAKPSIAVSTPTVSARAAPNTTTVRSADLSPTSPTTTSPITATPSQTTPTVRAQAVHRAAQNVIRNNPSMSRSSSSLFAVQRGRRVAAVDPVSRGGKSRFTGADR